MSQEADGNKIDTLINLKCHRCGNSGRTLYPLDIVEDGAERKVYVCVPCTKLYDQEMDAEERRQLARERLRRHRLESHIPVMFESVTLNDFIIPEKGNDFSTRNINGIKNAKEKILKFNEAVMSGDSQMIALAGEVGTGKSMLSCAIMNNVINKRKERAQLFHTAILVKRMMDNLQYEEILIDIARNYLTVIDDITSASVSEFTRKAMSDIINMIYVEGKSLIINGNVGLKELQENYIGARGYDRINDSTAGGFINFNWSSFRGLKI